MTTSADAFTVQLNKRMSNNWQLTAALTYLDSRGRLASSNGFRGSSGLLGIAAAQSGQVYPFFPFGANPNDFVNTDGKLMGDRPWTFRTQMVYELPHGFLVGANYTYQSGRPYARLIRLEADVLGQTTTILAERITGDRRVASWNALDIRLQKSFEVGRGARIGLFADLLNTFNDDAHENVLDFRGDAPEFETPSKFVLPRRLMLGAKFTF
jgi:hypothetical protein